ncbi:MAG TPA: amino acid adenylation domain-containing protein, partial [Candidatus Eisenbacteria bacterium]|nr:amino acid adenylation domain-containing protein [Candidatus Eisenbacteria bacterium]
MAPSGPLERAVADVWESLLDLPAVGAHDDFFALGGHSLLAMRAVSRLSAGLGREVPLRAVFEAPTPAALAARLAGTGAPGPPLRRLEPGEERRPSHGQRRLWFLERLVGPTAAYTVTVALRLRGELDVARLRASLNGVLRRHEVLRARFLERDDGEPAVEVDAWEVGLEAEPGAWPDVEVEARRPVELAGGRPVRARLWRLGAGHHVLLLVLHHAVFDGWSADVLLRELGQAYGGGEPEPADPAAYWAWARWQRERLAGGEETRQLAWWTERLRDWPEELDLPADRPLPVLRTFAGAAERVELAPALARRLADFGLRHGATLYMTLLAAWQVLMARLSGQDRVAVGTPVANRRPDEVEGLVGFFVNTLVMRGDLRGEPTFVEHLGRVREEALGAYEHQDLPFERLVEELRPERDLSRNPLFQVMFSLQHAGDDPVHLGDLGVRVFPLEVRTTRFDLGLALTLRHGRLTGWLEYSTELFEEGTVRRWLGHWGRLLEGVVEDPEAPVWALPLLGREERGWLLERGRGVGLGAVPDVVELVAEQAARQPGRVAVRWPGGELTYGELEREAEAVAARLGARGVGREDRVGVLLGRTGRHVSALLGVLEAGAAYVPLDPEHPDERLRWVVRDAGAVAVLVEREQVGRLEGVVEEVVVDEGEPGPGPAARPRPAGEQLAYVVYTSGSTGWPKGVMATRAGLANLVAWTLTEFGFREGERATWVSALGFDASAWELWPALAGGLSLHVPPEEARRWPRGLRDWLLAEAIQVSHLTTPLAEAVMELEWPASTALRLLLTGSDRLRRHPRPGLPFRLVNDYGPTEATVIASSGQVPTAEAAGGRAPGIGGPVANARICLLDRHLEPVPEGVVGQLCISGAGLTRGYLGRPGLTAERFLPDPQGGPGGRIYLSGDLARWRGRELEFVGRADQQVKIRG